MTAVAIYAQGEMGAGVARRLTENGARVLTALEGRSEASRRRAAEARMEPASWDQMAEADFFLSIVPPGSALTLAGELAERWKGRKSLPIFVDCNAVSPKTATEIAAKLEAVGIRFVDAGIIGGPPKSGGKGPKFYASGQYAEAMAPLRDLGLTIAEIDGPVGAASALKMAYGGITKGMTAIGAMMSLAAQRSGAGEALRRELLESQPAISAWLSRQCIGMIPKAYRWVAEMEEISEFQGDDQAGALTYQAIAQFYARLAEDEADARRETALLRAFFSK